MKNYNLNFHQTFPPTPEYLMRLLEVCDTGLSLTKEQISERTGIPTGKSSGKVEPHICYCEYMGLIEDTRSGNKHELILSPLGKEVLNQDPGLQEKISTALCHARLTSLYGGATLWSILLKDIFHRYPNGISDLLLKDELEKRLGANVKTGPFFSSYSGMFENLSLLVRAGTQTRIARASFDRDLIYVYAYALLYEWEKAFPVQQEITASELNSLHIGETFGLPASTFYEVLESLTERGIVRFNRQLAPYTLLRLHQSESMIPLLYSELC